MGIFDGADMFKASVFGTSVDSQTNHYATQRGHCLDLNYFVC